MPARVKPLGVPGALVAAVDVGLELAAVVAGCEPELVVGAVDPWGTAEVGGADTGAPDVGDWLRVAGPAAPPREPL